MPSRFLRCAAFVIAWAVASSTMGAAEVAAATKYKVCTLLTAAEVEAVLKRKLSRTDEGDVLISEGLYKGEVMSNCSWTAGAGTATAVTASLAVTRAPRTPQERAEHLKIMNSATEGLKQQGWSTQAKEFGGVDCDLWRPPAGTSDLPTIVGCAAEKGGLAFSISIMGGGLQITMEQVKSLVEKAASRIR